MKRGRRGRHVEGREQGVKRTTRRDRVPCSGSVVGGRPWAQLTIDLRTLRKDAIKVKYREAMWERECHDRMGNWDVCTIRVMNLNIGGRWGKMRGSGKEGRIEVVRPRRQFHPNVFVLNVWVQYFVFLQSLLCRSGDLNWPSRVTGMLDRIKCGVIIPPLSVCLPRCPIEGISSNHWPAEVHCVAIIAFVSMSFWNK